MKNSTEVALNLLSNVIGNSNDETNFSHKLLLTNRQVSRLCNTSSNIKLSKTQTLPKIGQSRGF